MVSANKAPADKLPLAVRKNVRDGWENRKVDLEAQLLTLLGVAWTFEVNPLAIFPYAEERSYGYDSLGDCIFAYCDNFIGNLRSFLEKHGDSGKIELNRVCPTHVVTLVASTKFRYCGTAVTDGRLSLLFHPEKLGTNINDLAQNLIETLSTAPQPDGASYLSFAARRSIETDYDAKIGAYLEKAQKTLQNPELKFEPGFNDIGAKLQAGKDVREDWETNLGLLAIGYYEGFLDILASEKFAEDDMLRDGLAEAAPQGVVKLRIVDTLTTDQTGHNEIVIDDGALVIQTTPENWGTNIHYATSKLVDIL
ncbi:hypothetical protein N7460_007011 [Penicillium canescens]|uniref:Uncharacterized protein n=2 Tax=Penicillium canescens TaxID=5083 RepID=A0AAD6IBV4_PENCN|nr:hypothetical protein N7460_007011 [Penicillium canescens]KAJ6064692.1 hypothetical protein N7444_000345 [Penicillium canescens]